MDTTQIIELSKWVIAIGFGAIITTITGIILIVKAGKLLTREVKGADLDNKGKEMDIVNQYDEIATKAADKVLNTQERFDKLEEKYNEIKAENAEIKERLEAQDAIISAQAKEINKLVCELNNYKDYATALIEQMRKSEITTIEMSSLNLQNCDEIQPKRKKNRMEDKNAPI